MIKKHKLSKKHLLTFIIFFSIFIALICSTAFFTMSKDKPVQLPESNTDTTILNEGINEAFDSKDELKSEDIKSNEKTSEVYTKKIDTPLTNKPIENVKSEEEKSEPIDNSNYTDLYPDLYCTRPVTQIIPDKTIFLTFDDGPSERTSEILDILKQKNVKATFFVTGNASAQGRALMKRIVDEGHTIAIHTYTHAFKQIYSSVKAYLDDFNKIYNLIYETTGVKVTIFRFPGGSKNGFNKNNYKEFTTEMTRRGFDYFDWNLSVGDAVSKTPTPVQKCINNVLGYSANCNHGVVLMHDAKPKHTTVEALPAIIDGLRNQGFTFDKLSHDINPAPYSLVKPYK